MRGLEPDNCYNIQNESIVRSRDEVDLTIDPPPDLAIEVDITSWTIDRLSIYAALGVPEVWRWHSDYLQVFVSNPNREYVEQTTSRVLAGFPFDRLAELIAQRMSYDETTLMRRFRVWCREIDM